MLSFALSLLLQAAPIAAPQTPPSPAWPTREADLTLRDFRFASGESLPELRLHYATLGTPHRNKAGEIDNAVVVLHGTGGSGKQFLSPQFANELYGPGQPLDIRRYFIIMPDNIGHGASSKPSDWMHERFPHYDYADMVAAQAKLLDHLGVRKLRLLFGTSMGCMHGFVWGTTHPERIQAMMPMACLPVEIAGQNRMWRKMAIDALRDDPVKGMRTAADLLLLAGLNPVATQAEAPTREKAEALLATRFDATIKGRDAEDLIWQLDSSRTYNPQPLLERMTMPVTWMNSADDFINPPGLGIAEREAKRLPNGKFILIPQSAETKGHGTHTWAKFWKGELVELLKRSE
ncbi:alpha/beta fold hydrolase [Sphingomonas sp. ID1715]|uniref:alpha/beta fold hydrolase n=1 Tax=Sphingomonas sp. ID1715 TaxID=1656898 RepID=UPI00148855DE|nr:alpha/beta fold hydrolase [Sphingomonas sp. ID1715]NNM76686.1 alpha/beta fold hydrolase [Sphingomonas sp. ID1715]